MKDVNWTHGAMFAAGGFIVGFIAGVATGEDVKKALDGPPATAAAGK